MLTLLELVFLGLLGMLFLCLHAMKHLRSALKEDYLDLVGEDIVAENTNLLTKYIFRDPREAEATRKLKKMIGDAPILVQKRYKLYHALNRLGYVIFALLMGCFYFVV